MPDIFIPATLPQKVMAVDPGARQGVAIFERGGCADYVLASAYDVGTSTRTVVSQVKRIGDDGVLVVERQYLKNIKGFEALLYRRIAWEVLAAVFTVPVALVYPASWQSKMLAGKGRGDTKGDALRACCELWPQSRRTWETSGDTRDAALLGLWYCRLMVKARARA